MGTHTVEEIADSIRKRIANPENYSVVPVGSYCYLMQIDGNGPTTPILSVYDDTISLHKKSPRGSKTALRKGLEDLGYIIPFNPVKIGGGLLYLYRNNTSTI